MYRYMYIYCVLLLDQLDALHCPTTILMFSQVVDLETHESLPSHQEGELYYHGPNIMKGYWQNSQATEDCLDGSWFRTG